MKEVIDSYVFQERRWWLKVRIWKKAQFQLPVLVEAQLRYVCAPVNQVFLLITDIYTDFADGLFICNFFVVCLAVLLI
jgi:hypothetical protein